MKKYTSLEHTIKRVVAEQNYRNQPIDEAVGAIGTDKPHDVPRAFFKSVHINPRKGEAQIPATGTTRAGRNYELEKAGVHKEEAETVDEAAGAALAIPTATAAVVSKTLNVLDRFVRSGAAPKRVPKPDRAPPAQPPAPKPTPKPEKPPGEVVPFKKPGEKPEQPPATPPAPGPAPKPGTTPKPTPDKKPPRELPKEPPAEPETTPESPPSEEPKKPEPKTTPPAPKKPPAPAPGTTPTPAPASPPAPAPAAPPAPAPAPAPSPVAPPAPNQQPAPAPAPANQPNQQPSPAPAQAPSGMPAPVAVPTPNRKNQQSPSPNAKPEPSGKKPEDKPRRDYPLPAGGGTSIAEPLVASARVPILSRIATPHRRRQAHFEETRYDIKNVGRPNDNRNDSIVGRPKDGKSKYTKQAEIIRKVVEEKRIILNKKKEENQGKNPLVDTEPTLKYNPLDQGTKDVR